MLLALNFRMENIQNNSSLVFYPCLVKVLY